MQSHTDSKEENSSKLAPEAPGGMVLTRYAECLYFAKSAYRKVKKALPLGADNNPLFPPGNKQETYNAIEMATQELNQHLSESLSPSRSNYRERFIQDLHCQAKIYSKHKAGNCTAQAAVAFTYLWKCNVRPISHAMIGDLYWGIGHAFIIVTSVMDKRTLTY